jgi:hypothetical protein
MIEYQRIGAPLSLHFESENLDLLQVGILNSSLHEIMNLVAIAIVDEENEFAQSHGEQKILDHIPQTFTRQDILIRASIIGVREGSIEFDIQPLLALVFTVPNAVAVLQNLAANVIWAIGTYGTRVVGSRIVRKGISQGDRPSIPETSARRRLRPRVERLLKHLKETSNGGRIVLRSGDEELIIEFYPSNGPEKSRQLR